MNEIMKKIEMDLTNDVISQDFWPLTHSSMIPNSSTKFYGTDNFDDYKSNLLTLPNDWIYRSNDITYNFNSSGLRMEKNLDSIDKKYIIGFGCSHTLGVGVRLEDTWPYILANAMGVDYINSAISGSSIKLNAINFFNMLGTVKNLPIAVAFAWPSSVRYCFYSDNEIAFCLPRFIPDDHKFKYFGKSYKDLLVTDFHLSEAIFYKNMVYNTCKRLGINYAQVSFDSLDEFPNIEKIKIIDSLTSDLNIRYARDVRKYKDGNIFAHVGKGLHKLAADELYKQFN